MGGETGRAPTNGDRPDRRSLLNWLLSTSTGALVVSILYPVFRFIGPPRVPESTTEQVEVGPVNDPELLEAGFKIIRFGPSRSSS